MSSGMTCAVLTWVFRQGQTISGLPRGWGRDIAHIGRDKEVVVGELEIITTSEDGWLLGGDVAGSHSRNLPGGLLGMSLSCFLYDVIKEWR